MHTSHHTCRRALLSALVTAAAISSVAAGPAAADTASGGRHAVVHQTPNVPVVIDGVRYKPKAIHRFDGQDVHLKLRQGPKGKPELVVSRKAPRLIRKGTARMSSPGGHVRFYEHFNGTGQSFTRNHDESVTNLKNICTFFCFGNWNDRISSVETNGAHTTLFEHSYFSGSSLEIPEEWGRRNDLRNYGFNDLTSSLWVD